MGATSIPMDEARNIASGNALSAERLLAGIDRISFVDAELRSAIAQFRADLVPELQRIATASEGKRKLNACGLLLELGDADGTIGLVDCLSVGAPDLRVAALLRLTQFPWNRDKGGYQVPLGKDAICSAVEPLLGASEPRTRQLALQVLTRLDTVSARARLTGLVAHDDSKLRLGAATWLAGRGEDFGSVAAIESALFNSGTPSNEIHALTLAIQNLARLGNEQIQARVATIAMRYVRSHLADGSNNTANQVWHCLEAIAAAAPDGESELLKEVLNSNLEWWVRGIALKRLASLEGQIGIDRLCEALEDKVFRKDAAEGLAKTARGTRNHRAIDSLRAALTKEADASTISTFVRAVIAVSGGDRTMLDLPNLIERVDPITAMSIQWIIDGIKPKDLAERLSNAGIADIRTEQQLADYEIRWSDRYDAAGILWGILGTDEKLWAFDCKTSSVADHAKLVGDLGKICRKVIAIDHASQSNEPGYAEQFRIRFVMGERAFSFVAQSMGRYYDLRSVVNGLNTVLQSLGHGERFFQLYTGDQFAIVVFAPEGAFMEVARDFCIPLELDPDSARQRGMEYTRYVLSTLK